MRLQYRTYNEKLNIKGHCLYKLGLGFTMTCIMIVYENVMIRIKAGMGDKIIELQVFCQ